MADAVTKDQTPLTDHRLSSGHPLGEFASEDTAWLDRWKRFTIEDLDRTEVTYDISQVASRISGPACPIVNSPSVEPVTRRESNARWFVGMAMLVVGLLAGYAVGVATTRNTEDQNASGNSLAADRADSGPQRTEFQATAGGPSTGPIAEAVNDELRISVPDNRPPQPQSIDELRISVPDSRPPQPQSIDARQRPVSSPVNTVPPTGPGVLHFESRPTGAQVHLDDRLVATTPFRLYGVSPGLHTIRMELQGYQPWSTSVNVEAESLARIAASLEQ